MEPIPEHEISVGDRVTIARPVCDPYYGTTIILSPREPLIVISGPDEDHDVLLRSEATGRQQWTYSDNIRALDDITEPVSE